MILAYTVHSTEYHTSQLFEILSYLYMNFISFTHLQKKNLFTVDCVNRITAAVRLPTIKKKIYKVCVLCSRYIIYSIKFCKIR